MKKLRFILYIVFFLAFIKPISAQQAPFYTQYMYNDYLINPAVAGSYNYFQFRGNVRIQWIGIEQAPRTMSVAGYGPIKNKDMGYGGYIYNDVTGPESWMSLGGSYAYNIAINDALRISGGLSIGIMQYTLDGTTINMDDEIYDPAITNSVKKSILPDANVGFLLWETRYYVGISAHQLFGSKYNKHEDADTLTGVSRLTQHVYLSGGYNIQLNRDFSVLPSVLLKYASPGQIQADINAKVTYKRMVWGGITYRTGDAIALLGGYNHENKFYIGMAYDITVSELRKYSSGTIEVMLGYRFNSIR